jgi:hypothetical protein
LQLALSLSDKRLCKDAVFVRYGFFFSGGNSCVPSVASEQSSSVEIRLNRC